MRKIVLGGLLVAAFTLGACGGGGAGAPSIADSGAPPADVTPADDIPTAPDVALDIASDGAAERPDVALDAAPDSEADVASDVPEEPIPSEPFAPPIAEEDRTFAVGPYVMHTTRTSTVIVWEDGAEGTPRVVYGRDSVVEGEALGTADEGGTIRTVRLEGLAPETVYEYRACLGETCTAELTFATAPRAGRPFRFAVYGDSRSDPAQHRAVVDTIIESRPAVVFHTGDVVEVGLERDQYPTMHFDPLRRLAHSVPVYVAIGNHEWKDFPSRVKNFRDYMVYPEDAGVPLKEASYSLTWGDTFALVMDNTLDGVDLFFPVGAGAGPPLWQWLNERVTSDEARAARWRFAFFHYPPESPCHEDWMNIVATREHVVPLLREHGFHAIFVGHVHGYERHDFDGLPVFITGGGGAGLQDEEDCGRDAPHLLSFAVVHHHLTVDVTPEAATVRAVDIDGQVVDELILAP